MEIYAITVYVISEKVLQILGIKADPQSQMSNAEVITFSLITAKFFSAITKWPNTYVKNYGYLKI